MPSVEITNDSVKLEAEEIDIASLSKVARKLWEETRGPEKMAAGFGLTAGEQANDDLRYDQDPAVGPSRMGKVR